jgi:hypothetical protein
VPSRSRPAREQALGLGQLVDDPFQLAGREIRVQRQAGALDGERLRPLGLELLGERQAAGILPDDGIAQGLAALAIPGDHGLALIVDAQRRRIPGPLDQAAQMIQQLPRVMLDPAGLGIDLAMLESAEAREAPSASSR